MVRLKCGLPWYASRSLVRSFTAALLCALSIAGSCLANEAVPPSEPRQLCISLREAVELSMAHNPRLRHAELILKQAELAYLRVAAENMANQSTYVEHNAKFSLEEAQSIHDSEVSAAVCDTVSAYFDLAIAGLDLAAKEMMLEVAEELRSTTEAKASARMAGEIELAQASASVLGRELEMARASDVLQEASWNLATSIGITRDSILSTSDVADITWVDIDLDRAIANAEARNPEVRRKTNELRLAELNLERAHVAGTPPLEKKAAQMQVDIGRLALAETKGRVADQVRAAYAAVVRAKTRVAIQRLELDLRRKSLQITTSQCKAGLVCTHEVTTAEVAVLEAEGALLDAQKAYFLCQLSLVDIMGMNPADWIPHADAARPASGGM